jgi:hypothetical protein
MPCLLHNCVILIINIIIGFVLEQGEEILLQNRAIMAVKFGCVTMCNHHKLVMYISII